MYLSPLLPSAHGSDHGYDVIGFDTVDPQRGGIDGWTRLLAAARARSLKVVVDIVPNHAGVADASENAAWWDVLQHGQDAEHASWFDIDWTPRAHAAAGARRRLRPVPAHASRTASCATSSTASRSPRAPATARRAEVHDRQHYELVNWRRADTDQNYRRFFAVTTLAGLRVEDPAVFDATHEQIARWVREDGIDGLRVDHPDGLADPRAAT